MSNLTPQDLLNLSLYSQLGIVFVAGILTSFTPCVYPLIPITLSIFGARSVKSKLSAFLLSISYVLGISTTYTLLGLIAALTGSFFGSFLSNPWFSLAIGLVLIFFGLAGLDIIQLRFSKSIQSSANQAGGTGHLGAYVMGIVSGIIAAPCTGPVLAAILVVAGASGEPLLGSLLLFVHALGLGVLFIILGTFSGLVNKIPKSGGWLYLVKFLTSSAIFLVALFFLVPAFRAVNFVITDYYETILVIITIILSIILGLIAMGQEIRSLKILAATCLAVSLFGLPSLFERQDISPNSSNTQNRLESLRWANSIDQALAIAKENNQIVMVDLYADWCAACKEYDRITFKDEKVRGLLNNISLARVDFTLPDDKTEKIEKDYKVIGLPTILFLDANGNEITNSRITGFLKPTEFLEHLNSFLPPTPPLIPPLTPSIDHL